LAEITKEESNFNDLYWTTDEFGSLVTRWMDNGLVFMVSTVHRIGKEVKRILKRPRITTLNKNMFNLCGEMMEKRDIHPQNDR